MQNWRRKESMSFPGIPVIWTLHYMQLRYQTPTQLLSSGLRMQPES